MDNTTFFRFARWLVITLAVCAGGIQGLAQSKAPQPTKAPPAQIQRWHGGQRTITDAAGRVHVRGERITYAQRRAVAQQRVKAMREAAAKRKLAEVTK